MADKGQHPTHIVLFHERSERNEEALTTVAGLRRRREAQASASIVSFSSQGAGRQRGRLYKSLRAAAVDLDNETAIQMQARPEVALVAPNKVRSLPRPRPATEVPLPTGGATDPATLYLRGLRDAAELTLAFLAGGGESPAAALTSRAPAMALDGQPGWPLQLLNLLPSSRFTGRGVRVAVLDTGIDLGHPDFSGRVQNNVNARGFVGGVVGSAQDGHGHGTHCAGVIAGPATPAQGGRYGVAPDAELLVGKVLADDGFGRDDDIFSGMQWAADSGARVISMSLGSPRGPNAPHDDVYELLAQALYEEEAGILLVAASGNESERPHFTRPVGNPAACPSILAVGAIDQRANIARFSDCQMDDVGEVDLVAPGVGIRSSWTGGGYWLDSGTSMACPHVAGVAALYLERDPTLSAKQLKEALVGGAKPLGRREDFGSGLVQAP